MRILGGREGGREGGRKGGRREGGGRECVHIPHMPVPLHHW